MVLDSQDFGYPPIFRDALSVGGAAQWLQASVPEIWHFQIGEKCKVCISGAEGRRDSGDKSGVFSVLELCPTDRVFKCLRRTVSGVMGVESSAIETNGVSELLKFAQVFFLKKVPPESV